MENLINSKEIIAYLLSSYNIPHRGWINLSPMWIEKALSEIRCPLVWNLIEDEELTLTEGNTKLPCSIKEIEYIKYKGYKLRIDHPNYNPNFNVNNEYNSNIQLKIHNGYIHTDIVQDDTPLIMTYRKLKTELDTKLGIEFPIIINNDLLKEAISWYILKRIMLQGLEIKPLSFNPNLPDLNPNYQFDKYTAMARNDMSFDKLVMKEIHSMVNTMIL